MNRIDAMFAARRREGKKALILYLTAGYPSLEGTRALVPALEAAGCDLLELGVPFSDPIADGPTIQQACAAALEGGTTLARILSLMSDLRSAGLAMPTILFGAFNPFLHYGLERVTDEAKAAGVDGFLCADLPPEEAGEFKALCDARGLKLIFLAAPTTSAERRRTIAACSSGFVYAITVKGITGARDALAAEEIGAQAAAIKAHTDLPVCVGFGISQPEHVAALAGQPVDGLIVGSALIKVIGAAFEEGGLDGAVAAASRFTAALKEPLK
ncbi:MAG: tryptophan synthase subunit alpha [Candidatus Sumerlaeia bacterium]